MAGTRARSGGEQPLRFVVQRHRATSDHYDLRLELDGVLVSWAVPKGPTLDPDVRRAAFRVEDHPLEYVDFEGVIGGGRYGAGDVIVWDEGTWRPHGTEDPAAALAGGELHLDVFGHKLRGRLALVRRGGPGDREQWLLVHKHDEHAVEGWDPDDHPRSVLSGLTNAEVAEHPAREWRSDLPAAEASVPLVTEPEGPGEEALGELDALGDTGTWHVFGRSLQVTDLDTELFPGRDGEPAVTKRELLRYAARVAPVVLPYLEGRAVGLRRPGHAPGWVGAWDDPDPGTGETTTYPVLDEPAAVVWAAEVGALEWRPWTSRTDAPDRPTYALVDLDPGEATTWEDVLVLARLHRTAFEHLGLRAFPEVTGRRGIQIWVPIACGPGFDETRAWVASLSRTVGAVVPELLGRTWQVRARPEHTRNGVDRTLVAPYSPRAGPGAPVAAPISWDELDDPALRPDGFTVRNVLDRVAERGDLFRGALVEQQRLPPLT